MIDDTAAIPKDQMRSAKKLAEHFYEHYEKGLGRRQSRAENWLRVEAIMRGHHWFRLRNGVLQFIQKDPDRIYAKLHIMKPMYRWEFGRISANVLGVQATASAEQGSVARHRARRAEYALGDWLEDDAVGAWEVHKRSAQYLCYYGGGAFYPYPDKFRQQVFVRAFPFNELFPYPWDSPTWYDASGIMRAVTVSKAWLEQQDELYEQTNGHARRMPLAKKAEARTAQMSTSAPGFQGKYQLGQSMEGATAIWIWLKPNEIYPDGLEAFMVNDQLVAIKQSLRLRRIPLEPFYYTESPDDFWPSGFCEDLIAPQLEANRQYSDILESARYDKAITFIDSEQVTVADIQASPDGLVEFNGAGGIYGDKRPPFWRANAGNVGRDVDKVLAIVMDHSRSSVGYESDIIFGQQEGRTEGGPATKILNTNAQAPLSPVMNNLYWAWKRVYGMVLDQLPDVWPEQKSVRVGGARNLGTEMMIRKDELPQSEQVILRPTQFLAGGQPELVNMLFTLRQTRSQDGKAFMLTDREFRRSLSIMGMNPPGLDMVDKVEQRILWRIGGAIGDGTKPADGFIPAHANMNRWRLEDHMAAVSILAETILDPSYEQYGPMVQQALQLELMFHEQLVGQQVGVTSQPDNFDDGAEREDMRLAENNAEAIENDPFSEQGKLVGIDGMPIV
jgi:hypothetical protein